MDYLPRLYLGLALFERVENYVLKATRSTRTNSGIHRALGGRFTEGRGRFQPEEEAAPENKMAKERRYGEEQGRREHYLKN